jgi:tight adherence protein C
MNTAILASLIFTGIAIPAFLLLNRLLDPDRQRLRRLAREHELDRERSLLPEAWIQSLASMTPGVRATGAEELRRLLRAAGYDRPTALQEYRAFRLLAILLSLGIAGFLGAVAPAGMVPSIAIAGVLAGLLAFSVPRAIITVQARARSQAIARGLPLAMDLMAISLQSGLDPINSARRVSDAVDRSYPELSSELRGVYQVAQFQTMERGWQYLADRVPTEEVRNLCSIMVQSERVGSDAATALTEFSNSYRANARLRAESQANRASFWMLFPTISCLFVASAIVLLGPVLYQFATGGATAQRVRDIQQNATDRLKSFRATPRSNTQPR